MSSQQNLTDVIMKAQLDANANEKAVAVSSVEPEGQEVRPRELGQEEVLESAHTENAEIVTISDTDKAKDVHSQTPHSALANLTALVDSKEEELAEVKQRAEEKEELEEINARVIDEDEIKNIKRAVYNDTVVEIEGEDSEEKEEAPKTEEEEEIDKDLLNLKIVKFKKSKDAKEKYKKFKEKRKAVLTQKAYQGVFPNSGYSAKFAAFASPELLNMQINLDNTDVISANELLYSKIYEKMVDTSVGKMTYDEFLKCTSLLELNSIFYCLFSGTYPDVNEFPAKCVHCGKEYTFKYNNTSLLLIDDDNKSDIIHNTVSVIKAENPEELLSKSSVNTIFRKRLSSGTVIDFRHPSLYNQLVDTLQKANTEIMGDDNTIINLMPFVENVYVETEDGFLELEDFADKFEEMNYLSDKDLKDCIELIGKIGADKKVEFGFKGLQCTHCKQEQPTQIIDDMKRLLFTKHQMNVSEKK